MRNEVVFERYGRVLLARKFPFLRRSLNNISKDERDFVHLFRSYGAAIALRDEMKRKLDCDPATMKVVETTCDELETEIAWSVQLMH